MTASDPPKGSASSDSPYESSFIDSKMLKSNSAANPSIGSGFMYSPKPTYTGSSPSSSSLMRSFSSSSYIKSSKNSHATASSAVRKAKFSAASSKRSSEIPRPSAIPPRTSDQKSSSNAVNCSRLEALMLLRVKGSTALLYSLSGPRSTVMPTPSFSSMPL